MPFKVESIVTWKDVLKMADDAARRRGEWAGCPIPVHEHSLVIEKRYPFSQLHGARLTDNTLVHDKVDPNDNVRLINHWHSPESNSVVYIYEENGKRAWYRWPLNSPGERLTHLLGTLGAGVHAWSVEAERRAEGKLAELVSRHAMECYLLTGTFLETSKRSGVIYMFRKNRPTIAMSTGAHGQMRILAVLCLHPIGYYDGTFAGVMCPTDEVIAHLVLMRGDERRFWAKSNKHHIYSTGAGV